MVLGRVYWLVQLVVNTALHPENQVLQDYQPLVQLVVNTSLHPENQEEGGIHRALATYQLPHLDR